MKLLFLSVVSIIVVCSLTSTLGHANVMSGDRRAPRRLKQTLIVVSARFHSGLTSNPSKAPVNTRISQIFCDTDFSHMESRLLRIVSLEIASHVV
jgi:hypothetical protein